MEDDSTNPIFNCKIFKTACSCMYSDSYELQCPSTDEPNILVKYDPKQYLEIDCLDNPTRNLFTLPNIEAQGIRNLSFRNCTLPTEGLSDITKKFNLISVDFLKIVITNFENITLSSEFLGEIRTTIKKLSLEGNGLEEIPYDTFEGMINLLVLDLNSNDLTELSSKYFRYLPNLLELDLSRNSLEKIAEDAFDGLTQLKRIHLWSNNIKTLPSDVFSSLTSLQSLEMSVNKLENLPDGIFQHLGNLEQINLRVNNLSQLHSNLFEKNAKLRTIRLDGNLYLTELPNLIFSNLSALTELQVFNCGLRQLPSELLIGSNNLTKLLFNNNYLTNLPPSLFLGLKQLQYLELQNNLIEDMPIKLFESLIALKKLDLTNNSLKKLNVNWFKTLNSLEELVLKQNNISEIVGHSFSGLENLWILDLSHNELTLIQEAQMSIYFNSNYESLFNSLFNLEKLDLSYNRITNLQSEWLLNKSKFRSIDLQHNNIATLMYSSLQATSNEKEVFVNLDYNRITTVDFSLSLPIAKSNPNSTVFIVQLTDNPWHCDCNLYDLYRYYKLELEPEVRARVEIKTNNFAPPMCKTPKPYRSKLITELPHTALMCPLLPPKDINSCPDSCTCHYRPYGHAVIIDCAKRNLTTLPSLQTSRTTTVVNLDKAPVVTRELYTPGLRWNGNGSEAGGIMEVWAQGNMIERIVEVEGYDLVELLDVSGNKVNEVDWLPRNLKVLKLHDNNIQELSDEILSSLNDTVNVTLENNPWRCDCDAVTLSNFLRDNSIDKDIRCNRTGLFLRKLAPSELCPSNALIILTITLLVLLPLLLCTMLAALYYRYQSWVKVWLYAHPLTQWLVTHEDLDRDKMYDAFMCYAHEDEDYVEKILKELEGGEHAYKVCIHRRDWLPGAMIADQITDSVRQSRRTIVVLSPSFLRSEWARMEFRTAHASELREGRARLIVILLGQLDPKVIEEDEDLRAYCSTKTYLKHDDPLFWQKLRYAMPHRGTHKTATSAKSAGGNKVSRLDQIMINIDRQELCATPTTPNPGTTPPAHLLGTEDSLLRRLDPMDFLVKNDRVDLDQLQVIA